MTNLKEIEKQFEGKKFFVTKEITSMDLKTLVEAKTLIEIAYCELSNQPPTSSSMEISSCFLRTSEGLELYFTEYAIIEELLHFLKTILIPIDEMYKTYLQATQNI